MAASAQVIVKVTDTDTLPAITATGTSAVIVQAAVAQTLHAVTLNANGTDGSANATCSGQIAPLTATATGTAAPPAPAAQPQQVAGGGGGLNTLLAHRAPVASAATTADIGAITLAAEAVTIAALEKAQDEQSAPRSDETDVADETPVSGVLSAAVQPIAADATGAVRATGKIDTTFPPVAVESSVTAGIRIFGVARFGGVIASIGGLSLAEGVAAPAMPTPSVCANGNVSGIADDEFIALALAA